MADAAALSVHLHPLVLINVSDHVVRFRHTGRADQRVVGALLGALEGRRVELHTSFELIVESADGTTTVDEEFFKQRLAQYAEVMPKYEFLGWYSTGCSPQESDKAFHKKIQEISGNDNPFVLLVDTVKLSAEGAGQSEELPVKVFDAATHLDEGGTVTVEWKEIPYAIDTLEAERIAVNHVAKAATVTVGGHSSDFTQHTNGLGNSVLMLNNRVKELLEYMKEVKAGRIPKNHDILRQMLTVCRALQATHQDDLQKEFCAEFNDASLVVLLGTLTKACANTSELLDKFQLAHDRKHHHRQRPFPWG
mmetsp:Transcript_102688/g.260854  ORF Transcript_102688/g.260854 Transcript_102688/m.260854 type:complete len:307 (-) Transcript_102688:61-981(-)